MGFGDKQRDIYRGLYNYINNIDYALQGTNVNIDNTKNVLINRNARFFFYDESVLEVKDNVKRIMNIIKESFPKLIIAHGFGGAILCHSLDKIYKLKDYNPLIMFTHAVISTDNNVIFKLVKKFPIPTNNSLSFLIEAVLFLMNNYKSLLIPRIDEFIQHFGLSGKITNFLQDMLNKKYVSNAKLVKNLLQDLDNINLAKYYDMNIVFIYGSRDETVVYSKKLIKKLKKDFDVYKTISGNEPFNEDNNIDSEYFFILNKIINSHI